MAEAVEAVVQDAAPNPLALTGAESDAFALLADVFVDARESLALVRSTLNGAPVAVVVYVQGDGSMTPLAVLVNDDVFDQLVSPRDLSP